jgi:hypothetical protein
LKRIRAGQDGLQLVVRLQTCDADDSHKHFRDL